MPLLDLDVFSACFLSSRNSLRGCGRRGLTALSPEGSGTPRWSEGVPQPYPQTWGGGAKVPWQSPARLFLVFFTKSSDPGPSTFAPCPAGTPCLQVGTTWGPPLAGAALWTLPGNCRRLFLFFSRSPVTQGTRPSLYARWGHLACGQGPPGD